MTNFKTSKGDLEMWLDCPSCDFSGIIYYKTQSPLYCSQACKQKAYRIRRMSNSPVVTHVIDNMGLHGLHYENEIRYIAGKWGIDAAEATGELMLLVARDVREKYQKKW